MSPRAKRPAPASPRTAIGIDVGGTGVKAAVVDLDTGALASPRLRVKTPQPATPESVVAVIGGSIPFILFFSGLAQATGPGAGHRQVSLEADAGGTIAVRISFRIRLCH